MADLTGSPGSGSLPVGAMAEALINASPDAVVIVDPAGTIRSCNRAVESLFGYQPAELVGQRIEVLVPERLRAGHTTHRTQYSSEPMSRPMGVGLPLFGQRRDGSTFPVDISLSPLLGRTELVAAFVRDGTERRRYETLLRDVNQISQELLAGRPIPRILTLTAGRARELIGAATAWTVVPAGAGRLVVAAADGRGAPELVGASLSASSSLSGRAIADGKPIIIEDLTEDAEVLPEARRLGLGAGLFLPLAGERETIGALVVGRERGAEPFARTDLMIAQSFASAAGVVLALGRARAELEDLQIVSEHERIARDLHDTVIQRLFAIGMGLQSLERRAGPALAERIDSSVQALDTVIRDIRETIFDLNRARSEGPDLRQRLGAVLSEARTQLGFEPGVSYRGPIESVVDEEVAVHLLAVLREALSNAARHSEATDIRVGVTADATFVVLSVMDNGVGLDRSRRSGHGMGNMSERARLLGGQLELSPADPRGTVLEWRVPVRGNRPA